MFMGVLIVPAATRCSSLLRKNKQGNMPPGLDWYDVGIVTVATVLMLLALWMADDTRF